MPITARELDYTFAQLDGPPEITFPFEAYGDSTAMVVTQRYKQTRAGFVADKALNRWVPGLVTYPGFENTYTNLLLYSADYANAVWTNSALTVTAGGIANPWGRIPAASKITETAANADHYIRQALTLTAQRYTYHVIAKGGIGRTYIKIRVGLIATIICNLSTGEVPEISGSGTVKSVDMGNGWWLFSLSYTGTAASHNHYVYAVADDGSTTTYAGDVEKGFYLAHAQVEAAQAYGPPIVTEGVALALDQAPYLQSTSETQATPTGLLSYARTFATVPATHYDPASRLFERPVMHDIVSGFNYAVSFNPDGSWIFANRKAVTGIAEPAISYTNPDNELATIGHQQVTIEMNSGSQSFYLDDSDATIKNALSTACTGGTGNAANFYVSRWTYGVYFSWAGISVTTKGITTTSTEVTVGTRTVAVGPASSTGPIEFLAAGTNRTSTRAVTSAGHGFTAGNRVALYNGDKIVALSKVVTAATDSFTVSTSDIPDADAVVTHCVADKDGTRYVNGAIDCSARIANRFYLPGVTAGIATMADIPNFTPKIDPVNWLAQIVAYNAAPSVNTYVVIETAALERWMGGPTLVKRVTELQLADALVTASATA